ncbi:hypothetical protein GWI33_016483 [Rhynchophorus ferrugineus]|uniref:BSD domain-containing protein n=1 Tax=Rhynchophorus ferrugineus TaxID=354439 RepID=A0A834I175_RHYFE|nr:hypothetical protein GWI33_016483 [Rhynchophorus ferrugineus]
MSENQQKSGSNRNSWLNSWLSAAKNKSTEVLEFVKKDLEEFGTVVKNEASSVVSSAGAVVEKTLNLESPDSTVNTVKRSFSTFLGQMNTVLNPTPDDSDTEILIIENSETHSLSKYQKALYELQKNPETYLCDPDLSLQQQYECWLEILESDQLSDDRIARHVNSSEVLKKHYAKLKALLEDELAKQEQTERREQKEKEETLTQTQSKQYVEKDELKWENEYFAANVELTEEEQIALLEEYEKEQKRKSLSLRKPAAKNSDSSKTVQKGESGSSGCSTDDDWEKIGDLEK